MSRYDHYAVLGVERDASPAEVKQAYRRLALDSHPDRFPGDPDAETRFRRISEAYAVLGDAAKRARYDRSLRLPDALDLSNPPNLQTAKDLFGNVFGDVFGNRRKQRRRGRDIRYTLTIPFRDGVLGSEHTISFEGNGACSKCVGSGTSPGGQPASECTLCAGRGELKAGGLFSPRTPCGRCDGTGMVQVDACDACHGRGHRREKRDFDVRVTPGTHSGAEKVLRGQGEPGRFGGEAGNLRVTINVKADPWLERKGDDVHLEIPISVTEATLGATVAVPTVSGWVDMEIPPGTVSGSRLRLSGKGVPKTRGGHGHQLVKVVIETPRLAAESGEGRAPERRARELLEALEQLSGDADLLPKRRKLRDAERER
jgi:molecular chaperone DnaJ